MKNERLILVTNDDGYNAKGLRAAIDVARQFGRVIAIAPEVVQSGMSQAITMYKPLFLKKQHEEPDVEVYSFSGTPVDCVKMAFDYLLTERKVDMVISGINHGSNAAVNVLYSGTMGAAIEGSFYGCPSIGLSLTDHDPDADFSQAVVYARQIVGQVFDGVEAHKLPTSLCLNVNFPAGCTIEGVRICRQTQGYWREEFYRREDPNHRPYFWLTGEFINREPDAEDTDEWALAHGYASIVPVQVDLTDYTALQQLRSISF